MDGFEPNRTLMLWSENFVVPLFCPVPVQFTEVPQNITVNTSTPLVLNCNATGFPEPKIRWEKSGIHLCGTKQLKISSINTNDAGEYICIASNGVRQEKTVRAYVTVQCKSLFQHFIKRCYCCWIYDTFQPIFNSTILNGHPECSFQSPFFSLNWCNFEKKEKLCILSNCNILENECIDINMYKFYQNIPKKTTNSKSISKKKPFQIQNFPNLTQLLAKMIWSSRRDATKHGFWLWIDGQRRNQSSLIRTQLKKKFSPWAFHTTNIRISH